MVRSERLSSGLVDDAPVVKISPPGTFVELDGEALFLGRDCHLAALIPCLLNRVVSNRHCVIRHEGPEHWTLEDLGSTNGTWMHGARLAGKTRLHTGDDFTLGVRGPVVSCWTGFGGAGADRTIAEGELDASEAVTLVEAPPLQEHPPMPPRGRGPDDRDGSADRPFRVGRAPSVRLVHQRTGESLTATGYTIVIGRDPAGAQIVIHADDERHVSGRHAEIQFRADGSVVVRDLGSRNGTWLNDYSLQGEAGLQVGDRLLLGNAPTLLIVTALET